MPSGQASLKQSRLVPALPSLKMSAGEGSETKCECVEVCGYAGSHRR